MDDKDACQFCKKPFAEHGHKENECPELENVLSAETPHGGRSGSVPGYVMGVDFGKDKDYTAVMCMTCRKMAEIVDGKLPPVGWCGCHNAEQEII